MGKLSIDTFKLMLQNAFADISAKADHYSELDAVCGDGDHGTAITSALEAIVNATKDQEEFKSMLMSMTLAAMEKSCGSTSSLIGSFFIGMATVGVGTELSVDQVKAMFKAGLNEVKNTTEAQVGDKTMMDALIPAITAMEDQKTIGEIFYAAAEKASQGARSTVEMKANFGRARNLGDRSVGSMDPGAASWSQMFMSFSNTINAI